MTQLIRCQLHLFPTFAMGGAQRRFLRLAALMPQWRHVIVAMDGVTGAMAALDPEVDAALDEVSLVKSSGFSFANIRRLSALIKSHQPDLLCTYNWGSIEASIANRISTRVPHLHFEDGFGPEEAVTTIPRRDMFRRMVLSGKTHVVVPSQRLRTIAQTKWGIPNSRLHYQVNGVDLSQFAMKNQVPVTDKPFIIGTVGALRAEKNIARLIQAVADAQIGTQATIRLHIIGDGALRSSLEDLAQRLDVDTVFFGNLDNTAQAYQDIDAFALTSDTEQMPLTVLEAMASGLPVIATDVGDIASMVAPMNADLIVPLGAAKAQLPQVFHKVMADAELCRLLGAANRQRAIDLYDEEKIVADYAALFDTLTS